MNKKQQAAVKEMIDKLVLAKSMSPKPPKRETLQKQFRDWQKKGKIA